MREIVLFIRLIKKSFVIHCVPHSNEIFNSTIIYNSGKWRFLEVFISLICQVDPKTPTEPTSSGCQPISQRTSRVK